MLIKVLAIDDDPNMTTLLKLFLTGDRFEFLAANTSIDGIEAARCWEPDVILLDLMLPGISGWEVCKQIRAFSQVPILILSVVTESEQLRQAINNGANDYISKPITKGELISHIIRLT